MQAHYPQIMDWLSVYEGGKVDHPKDPGGRTNRGVTQRVYDAWRRANGRVKQDVYLMSDAEHDAIYREQYWNPIWGDRLPSGVDGAMFDFAVNSGVARSVKYTQAIVGVTADGIMGNNTFAAIQDYCEKHSPAELVVALCNKRMSFLRRLSTFATFGKGWTRRVVGHKEGVQEDDIGVLDRCVMLSRETGRVIPLPKAAAGHKAVDESAGLVATIIDALANLLAALTGKRGLA